MNSLMPDHRLQPQLVPVSGRKSGRAVTNERGLAVWEWQVETGVFEQLITEEQLRRLEAPGLSLVEESPASRNFEGLWIHDAHRPVERKPQQSGQARPARKAAPSASNPLRLLWARICGV